MRAARNTSTIDRAVWAIPLVLCLLVPVAWAADPAPEESKPAAQSDRPASSLDDALLEDLDNELLEGLGDLKDRPSAPQKDPKKPSPDTPPVEPIDGEDIGDSGADDDPLGYISQEMRLAEELIPQRDKRNYAQSVQQRILEDLSKLIEQAQQQRAQQQSANSKQQQQQQTAKRQSVKQPKSSSSPSQGQQNKPASDSTDRLGKAERARPDPALFQGLLKDTWGNLPEREREQMLQMSPERFLPQYELMIERYYQRLSEERLR